MTSLDISAVIISYNSSGFLSANLKSLQEQSPAFKKIVFVDNHSQDDSREWLKRQSGIHLVLPEKNLGYAAAVNKGIANCSSRIVLIANADIILERNFTQIAGALLNAQPEIGLVSPLILRFDGLTIDSAGQECSRALYPRERGYGSPLKNWHLEGGLVFSVCGAATIINRDAFINTISDNHFYDEDFFMFWEDFDLGWTATEQGIPVWFCPELRVRHFRSATLRAGLIRRVSLALARPPQLKFHLIKNRYLTLIKHFRLKRHWRHIPAMLAKDLLWVGLLTISAPKTIIMLLRSGSIFHRALKTRKKTRNNSA